MFVFRRSLSYVLFRSFVGSLVAVSRYVFVFTRIRPRVVNSRLPTECSVHHARGFFFFPSSSSTTPSSRTLVRVRLPGSLGRIDDLLVYPPACLPLSSRRRSISLPHGVFLSVIFCDRRSEHLCASRDQQCKPAAEFSREPPKITDLLIGDIYTSLSFYLLVRRSKLRV